MLTSFQGVGRLHIRGLMLSRRLLQSSAVLTLAPIGLCLRPALLSSSAGAGRKLWIFVDDVASPRAQVCCAHLDATGISEFASETVVSTEMRLANHGSDVARLSRVTLRRGVAHYLCLAARASITDHAPEISLPSTRCDYRVLHLILALSRAHPAAGPQSIAHPLSSALFIPHLAARSRVRDLSPRAPGPRRMRWLRAHTFPQSNAADIVPCSDRPGNAADQPPHRIPCDSVR